MTSLENMKAFAYIQVVSPMFFKLFKFILLMCSILLPYLFRMRKYSINSTRTSPDMIILLKFLNDREDYGTNGYKNNHSGYVFGKWYFGHITSINDTYRTWMYIKKDFLTTNVDVVDDVTLEIIDVTSRSNRYSVDPINATINLIPTNDQKQRLLE